LFAQAAGASVSVEVASHPMLHPGQSAALLVDGVRVGYVGALNPALNEPLVSRFPHVRRDLALLVDEGVSHDDILASVDAAAPAALQSARVFDIYRGKGLPEGKKSVALSLILQDISRTLVESDVDKAVSGIVDGLGRDHDARIRDY